jgi:osmotically inducible protein OsmC
MGINFGYGNWYLIKDLFGAWRQSQYTGREIHSTRWRERMKTLYTAKATTIAGRDGQTETDDGRISHALSRPGSGGAGTNPEQLFACGYSACFGSALEAIARKEKIPVEEVKVQAEVNLNEEDGKGYFLSVRLNVSLEGVDRAKAQELVKSAHQICPYSKATRGNIDVELALDNSPLSTVRAA